MRGALVGVGIVPLLSVRLVGRCVLAWPLGSRERDLDREASVWLGVGGDGGLVRGNDCLNDREPQAVAVAVSGAHAVQSLEWLEQASDVAGRCDRGGRGQRRSP